MQPLETDSHEEKSIIIDPTESPDKEADLRIHSEATPSQENGEEKSEGEIDQISMRSFFMDNPSEEALQGINPDSWNNVAIPVVETIKLLKAEIIALSSRHQATCRQLTVFENQVKKNNDISKKHIQET